MENTMELNSSLGIILPPRRRISGRYYVYNRLLYLILISVDAILSVATCLSRVSVAPNYPKRILVSNCADYGDLVIAMPALRALRHMFPDSEIGFLSSSKTRAVLAGTGLVDRQHFVEGRIKELISSTPLPRLPGAIWSFARLRFNVIREIKAFRYDVAIDLYLFPFPASPILFWADIPVRAGFTSGGFGPLLTHPVEPGLEPRAIIDRPRDLFAAIWPDRVTTVARLKPFHPGYAVTFNSPFEGSSPYWIVHMGAGAAYKEWPEENWLQLVEGVLARKDVRILFTGSGLRERDRVKRVCDALSGTRHTAFLDRSWEEFVNVVARAERVICLDSAIVHVAAAFGVPTTALFTGRNDLREWCPESEICRVVMAPVECAPCNRRDCTQMTCLTAVTPDMVADKL